MKKIELPSLTFNKYKTKKRLQQTPEIVEVQIEFFF